MTSSLVITVAKIQKYSDREPVEVFNLDLTAFFDNKTMADIYTARIRQLEKELQEIKKTNLFKTKEELQTTVKQKTKLESDYEKAMETLSISQVKREDLENKIKNLNAKFGAKGGSEDLTEITNNIQTVLNDLVNEENHRKQLEQNLAELTTKYNKLRSDTSDILYPEITKSTLATSDEQLITQAQGVVAKIRKLENKNDSWNTGFTKLANYFAGAGKENKKLQTQIEILKNDIFVLTQQLAQEHIDKENLQTQLNTTKDKINRLQEDFVDFSTMMDRESNTVSTETQTDLTAEQIAQMEKNLIKARQDLTKKNSELMYLQANFRLNLRKIRTNAYRASDYEEIIDCVPVSIDGKITTVRMSSNSRNYLIAGNMDFWIALDALPINELGSGKIWVLKKIVSIRETGGVLYPKLDDVIEKNYFIKKQDYEILKKKPVLNDDEIKVVKYLNDRFYYALNQLSGLDEWQAQKPNIYKTFPNLGGLQGFCNVVDDYYAKLNEINTKNNKIVSLQTDLDLEVNTKKELSELLNTYRKSKALEFTIFVPESETSPYNTNDYTKRFIPKKIVKLLSQHQSREKIFLQIENENAYQKQDQIQDVDLSFLSKFEGEFNAGLWLVCANWSVANTNGGKIFLPTMFDIGEIDDNTFENRNIADGDNWRIAYHITYEDETKDTFVALLPAFSNFEYVKNNLNNSHNHKALILDGHVSPNNSPMKKVEVCWLNLRLIPSTMSNDKLKLFHNDIFNNNSDSLDELLNVGYTEEKYLTWGKTNNTGYTVVEFPSKKSFGYVKGCFYYDEKMFWKIQKDKNERFSFQPYNLIDKNTSANILSYPKKQLVSSKLQNHRNLNAGGSMLLILGDALGIGNKEIVFKD